MGTDLADIVYLRSAVQYRTGLFKRYQHRRVSTKARIPGKKDSQKGCSICGIPQMRASRRHSAVAKPNAHVFYWCDERYIWLLQTLYRAEQDRQQAGVPVDQKQLQHDSAGGIQQSVRAMRLRHPGQAISSTRTSRTPTNCSTRRSVAAIKCTTRYSKCIDLWLERRDNAQSYEHPTQKPVTLNEKPLKRCSAPGHIIFSGFAGSGSDLIACEQLRRKWRGIEKDPIFATVCIDRWEAFTNLKPKLL